MQYGPTDSGGDSVLSLPIAEIDQACAELHLGVISGAASGNLNEKGMLADALIYSSDGWV